MKNEHNVSPTKRRASLKPKEIYPPEIVEYLSSPEKTTSIAKRYDISVATLTARAKKWGAQLRGRGRHAALAPSPRARKILRLVETETYERVGEIVGCTKQRVQQIVKRWGAQSATRFGAPVNATPTPPNSVEKASTCVISFRLTTREASELYTFLPRTGSVNKSARHVVRTFLSSLRS